MNEPKERPIIFSGPMIQAILDGRKTQTRRVIKSQPEASLSQIEHSDLWTFTLCEREWRCPFGVPGDRLWVRETWAVGGHHDSFRPRDMLTSAEVFYKASGDKPSTSRWRSPIHMPRWASRITLDVTGIRVERVQEISEADAIAEGWPKHLYDASNHKPRKWFRELWDSLNAKRGHPWENNDRVWVGEFRRIEP